LFFFGVHLAGGAATDGFEGGLVEEFGGGFQLVDFRREALAGGKGRDVLGQAGLEDVFADVFDFVEVFGVDDAARAAGGGCGNFRRGRGGGVGHGGVI
jgi:hypothetical protein